MYHYSCAQKHRSHTTNTAQPCERCPPDVPADVFVQDTPEVMTFLEWQKHFSKSYRTAVEEAAAAKVFASNVAFITEHNSQADVGAHTYRCVGIIAEICP